MSTQIDNSKVSDSIAPTFEALHYIYKSTKSPTGYVVSKRLLQGNGDNLVWSCPSNDLALMWVSHQLLMRERQEAINNGMTKKEAVATIQAKALDTTTQPSYNEEATKVEDTTMNAIDINAMTLQELASLQFKIANRMNYLITQQALQQTNENTTQREEVEQVQPQDVAESSVETQEIAPSNAVKAAPTKRKIKSKKASNVEAVAAKIDTSLCVMSRADAKAYIKEYKLPIKSNMNCEDMNDAINAYKQGGVEAVPAQYLTKSGCALLKTVASFAKEEEVPVAKKTVLKSKSPKVK